MKKSDMIAALTGYLMDYKRDSDDTIKYNSRDLAKFVLSCVEKQGMQPPELRVYHEEWCEFYDGESCNCDGYKENRWEPEDD